MPSRNQHPQVARHRAWGWALLVVIALCEPCLRAAVEVTAISGTAAQDRAQLLSSVVDGLQHKYSRLQSLAADFLQTYVGGDGRIATERGRVLLKRPGKARWDYTEPEKKVFLSDGRVIYFYVLGEREALRSSVRESRDPRIPFLFLLGRGDLRRDFSRIEITSEFPAERSGLVLLLVPRKAPEEFKQLLAEVNPATFTVTRLVIFKRNGARMTFFLSNVRENQVAPDNQFTFKPPPDPVCVRPRVGALPDCVSPSLRT